LPLEAFPESKLILERDGLLLRVLDLRRGDCGIDGAQSGVVAGQDGGLPAIERGEVLRSEGQREEKQRENRGAISIQGEPPNSMVELPYPESRNPGELSSRGSANRACEASTTRDLGAAGIVVDDRVMNRDSSHALSRCAPLHGSE
jgi:hypothetical protein